jgi:hypothetical protein
MSLYHFVDNKLVEMTPDQAAAVPVDWPVRAVNDKLVPLTQTEYDDFMAGKTAYEAGAAKRLNAPIKAQLAEIDRLAGAGRGLREFVLVQAMVTDKLIEQGTIVGAYVGDNAGIVKIRALEAQAVALRAQLTPE